MNPQVETWFQERGWKPLAFQRRVWEAMQAGRSGLIFSSTGSGKTMAVWMGRNLQPVPTPGLKLLWITPLRALAADTLKSLEEASLGWTVELRTGDTSSSAKSRQFKKPPDALVTTPESLTLLLARDEACELLQNVEVIVVDEWHELLGTKRGVQTELALARVRSFAPQAKTWGLSATLGDLKHALRVLLPAEDGELIAGEILKDFTIDSILPETIERFPWAGHLRTSLVKPVAAELAQAESSLVFTNTRSAAEIWFQALREAAPEWQDRIGIHHGSLDHEERERVEDGLKSGRLKCVVCTSSLDLGVDFSPVERVMQIGSPKGVARLLQRAGRSGHRPGVPSRITCVPTHALELLDVASVRAGAKANLLEDRLILDKPLDVLVQHVVTIALVGFNGPELLKEVRATFSYRNLTDEEWQWVLDFVTQGGQALGAYPEFRKVQVKDDWYIVEDQHIATRHRGSIGTILSDSALEVRYLTGGRLGTVEESFGGRLKRGDVFSFSGKFLEFVMIKEMTLYVRRATSVKGAIPRWAGSRMPLSTQLSKAMRTKLEDIRDGIVEDPEVECLLPLLAIQSKWSAIPGETELLIEQVKDREGFHLFFFPMEGRLVHEGLAALTALRLSRFQPISFSIACNDYGFELVSPTEAPLEHALQNGLFSSENLLDDIFESLNGTEMARRQFREIARIAGLIFQGNPGRRKTTRQIQASSGLFFDVFSKYDPANLLLHQASREVIERNLEQTRLSQCLVRLNDAKMVLTHPRKPTPFAFPILVDRLREQLASEDAEDRIRRMLESLEKAAG
jgi:ATP-dependent Lhr-like helicase